MVVMAAAVRRGRHATASVTPCCQRVSMRSTRTSTTRWIRTRSGPPGRRRTDRGVVRSGPHGGAPFTSTIREAPHALRIPSSAPHAGTVTRLPARQPQLRRLPVEVRQRVRSRGTEHQRERDLRGGRRSHAHPQDSALGSPRDGHRPRHRLRPRAPRRRPLSQHAGDDRRRLHTSRPQPARRRRHPGRVQPGPGHPVGRPRDGGCPRVRRAAPDTGVRRAAMGLQQRLSVRPGDVAGRRPAGLQPRVHQPRADVPRRLPRPGDDEAGPDRVPWDVGRRGTATRRRDRSVESGARPTGATQPPDHRLDADPGRGPGRWRLSPPDFR